MYQLDAERALLGGLLIAPEKINEVEAYCNDEDFSITPHCILYRRIRELYREGTPADMVTLFERLTETKEIDIVKASYFAELIGFVPTAANIKHYAKIVRKHSTARKVQQLTTIANARVTNDEPLEEIIGDLQVGINNANKPVEQAESAKLELVKIVSDEIEAAQNGILPISYLTGISALDRIDGGMKPGQLWIIAARPSIGKTILADQICQHTGKSALYFCLEMTATEMVTRAILRSGDVTMAEIKEQAQEAAAKFSYARSLALGRKSDSYYYDNIFDLGKIISAAHRETLRRKIDIVVVDYAQLISTKGRNRNEEVGLIAREMKELAKKLEVVVILVSQLNRDNERQNRMPALSDLRDSGELEQAADVVLMLHSVFDEKKNMMKPETGLLVRKYRNGYLMNIPLLRDGAKFKFTEVDGRYESESEVVPFGYKED